MDKKFLAKLIDAYAAARSTKNQYLISLMTKQVEEALDIVFDEQTAETQPLNGQF